MATTVGWDLGQRVWIWHTASGASEVSIRRIELVSQDGGFTVAMNVKYEQSVLSLWLNEAAVFETQAACEAQHTDELQELQVARAE